jgi:GNAT superfamily N-acetyltransferase
MYIDTLPILSFHRFLRSRARNLALRNESRATGMVGLSNGEALPPDTIVRFDIAAGEDPGRLLESALNETRARAFWFYGGDDVARRAAADLALSIVPSGAVFARRMEPLVRPQNVVLRPPGVRDRMTLSEVHEEHARGFLAPETLFALVDEDIVGVTMSEALDAQWTEVRVVVYPAYRGRGHGTAILSVLADRLEAAGRLICAAIETVEGRGRGALEQSGFRLADYYFTGRHPANQ